MLSLSLWPKVITLSGFYCTNIVAEIFDDMKSYKNKNKYRYDVKVIVNGKINAEGGTLLYDRLGLN
jgi:hypothetical protein